MRRAGTGSWRFAHDIDDSLHCIVYLRDALRIPSDAGSSEPPHLVGEVPDRSVLLNAAESRDAATLVVPMVARRDRGVGPRPNCPWRTGSTVRSQGSAPPTPRTGSCAPANRGPA